MADQKQEIPTKKVIDEDDDNFIRKPSKKRLKKVIDDDDEEDVNDSPAKNETKAGTAVMQSEVTSAKDTTTAVKNNKNGVPDDSSLKSFNNEATIKP
jgi:hypothetical protein